MNKKEKPTQVNNTEQMNEPKQETKEKKAAPVVWWRRKGTIASAICLVALIAGLLFWQPWNKAPVPIEDPLEVSEQEETEVDNSVAKEEGQMITEQENQEQVPTNNVQNQPATEEPKEGENQPSATVQQPKQETTQTPAVQQQPSAQQQPSQPSVGEQTPAQQPVQEQPAVTHTHSFDTPIYNVVHHEAVTEQKYVVDHPAIWTTNWNCSCGFTTTNESELYAHFDQNMFAEDQSTPHSGSSNSFISQEEQGHYETVVVAEAYDEEVIVGYKCSCGATQ